MLFQLLQGDVHPLCRHVHPPVKLPQCVHASWVCERAVIAGHRVRDHAEKVPAIPPAGLSPLLREQGPARLNQLRLCFQQVGPRLVHQLIRPLPQMAGDAGVDSGCMANALQLPMGQQALSQVGFVDQSACGLRQRTVGAESLNPGVLGQGFDVGVLVDQELIPATGVAINQPWRSR